MSKVLDKHIENLFTDKSEEELCQELINSFNKNIWRVYYPSRNILMWFIGRKTRMGWVSDPITRRIYEAVLHGKYIPLWEDTKLLSILFENRDELQAESKKGDQLVSKAEALEFAEQFAKIHDCRWKLFSGWIKFWTGDELKPGERLFIKSGDPDAAARKIAKIMTPR